jgi:hypothetical protein
VQKIKNKHSKKKEGKKAPFSVSVCAFVLAKSKKIESSTLVTGGFEAARFSIF